MTTSDRLGSCGMLWGGAPARSSQPARLTALCSAVCSWWGAALWGHAALLLWH